MNYFFLRLWPLPSAWFVWHPPSMQVVSLKGRKSVKELWPRSWVQLSRFVWMENWRSRKNQIILLLGPRLEEVRIKFWRLWKYYFWCLECVWYGEVLCDGAVVQDLYRWWFLLKCSKNKMKVISRSWSEVASDPRYKPGKNQV